MVAAALVLAAVGGCGGASRTVIACGSSLALGSHPTVAHPLSCAKRTTLARAAASVRVPLVLPKTMAVRPSDVGPVWTDISKRPARKGGTVAVTFPAQGVIVEYTRPVPFSGQPLPHFQRMAKGLPASVVDLKGTPALVIRQDSDVTGRNFGVVIFKRSGAEVRVMGHNDQATLEASPRPLDHQPVHGVEEQRLVLNRVTVRCPVRVFRNDPRAICAQRQRQSAHTLP